MSILIREVREHELESVLGLNNSAGTGILALDMRQLQFAFDHAAYFRVAEVAGALVLMVEPVPRRRHVASIGMAVHDDWAGRGVGTALMQAALDLADNWLGLTRVELTVWADNQAALALYRKAGFVEEGVARDYGLRHGVLVDALYMARVRR